ncbi:MAG TPA: ATP-binding protein, partial [Geminicoccus sp.]|uniref:PAS domain-containing hybrid sensor histidine kinase/response regulator n=1 Tax=Geminicoccus sp. TaxID=2024832 RepID=UPI002E3187DB
LGRGKVVEWDETGAATRLIATSVDITEQKRIEADLAEKSRENEIYRAIFESMPDRIYAKDRDGRFIIANQATAAAMGVDDPTQLYGRTDMDLYPPDMAARYRDDEARVVQSGRPALLEQSEIRGDGQFRWMLAMKVPMFDQAGNPDGLVGLARDVSEQKQREQMLAEASLRLEQQASEMQTLALAAEQANLAKSEFLAAMSHEIRTPMTGVLGMADLLASEGLSRTQRHYVETICRSGSHLLNIINSILDFSRIEAGRLELEQIDFVPQEVLEQVHSLLAPQATERGLALRMEHDVPAGMVLVGDPTRLCQILVNLASNALKFTTQGEVAVAMHQSMAETATVRLRFEVRDTGIGIPLERQAALFEPFVQADRSTNRQYGGSGLGLAICKRLVEAMDGVIGVDSSPGKGSTFWFEVNLQHGTAKAAAARSVGATLDIRPLRILVVDDVPANRELMSTMLTRRGHAVELAENGAQAVEAFKAGGYDVVLMDVQMPVMDGMEATRRIRQLPAPLNAIPVLALTANVLDSERRRCLSAGMDRCLTKPVVWNELFDALAQVVGGNLASVRLQPDQAPQFRRDFGQQLLLNSAQVDAMGARMTQDMLRTMLERGLSGAEESTARLHKAAGDAARMAAEAHRLRGTAGTFGLARIADLAGAIERWLDAGQDAAELLSALDDAVVATRGAIGSYLAGRPDRVPAGNIVAAGG